MADLSRIESEHGARRHARARRVRPAPGRGVRGDALDRPVRLGGSGRPPGRRGGRSGVGPAGAEGDADQPERRSRPLGAASCVSRTVAPIADKGFYWSRIAVAVGSAFEFAGWRPLTPDGEPPPAAWVSRLLGAPLNAEFIVYADPGRGDFRYASLVEGRLEACLFLGGPGPRCRPAKACSPRSTTPSRRTAAPMFWPASGRAERPIRPRAAPSAPASPWAFRRSRTPSGTTGWRRSRRSERRCAPGPTAAPAFRS